MCRDVLSLTVFVTYNNVYDFQFTFRKLQQVYKMGFVYKKHPKYSQYTRI